MIFFLLVLESCSWRYLLCLYERDVRTSWGKYLK